MEKKKKKKNKDEKLKKNNLQGALLNFNNKKSLNKK